MRTPRRLAVVCVLAVLFGWPAVVADAHVTVHPISATGGDTDGTLAFRVPDESDTASTTQVQVYFPTDHPIASVLVLPLTGWTDQVRMTTLATPLHTDDADISSVVAQVTWTGGRITPGHYQDFTVTYGLLPADTDALVFKAVQTYSDGTVVRWIDQPSAAEPDPQHPAPVLRLTPAATTVSVAEPTKDDGVATGLAIAALVVALGAFVVRLAPRR